LAPQLRDMVTLLPSLARGGARPHHGLRLLGVDAKDG
jgi:hypothetical protein